MDTPAETQKERQKVGERDTKTYRQRERQRKR